MAGLTISHVRARLKADVEMDATVHTSSAYLHLADDDGDLTLSADAADWPGIYRRIGDALREAGVALDEAGGGTDG